MVKAPYMRGSKHLNNVSLCWNRDIKISGNSLVTFRDLIFADNSMFLDSFLFLHHSKNGTEAFWYIKSINLQLQYLKSAIVSFSLFFLLLFHYFFLFYTKHESFFSFLEEIFYIMYLDFIIIKKFSRESMKKPLWGLNNKYKKTIIWKNKINMK